MEPLEKKAHELADDRAGAAHTLKSLAGNGAGWRQRGEEGHSPTKCQEHTEANAGRKAWGQSGSYTPGDLQGRWLGM